MGSRAPKRATTPGVFKVNLGGPVPGQPQEDPDAPRPMGQRNGSPGSAINPQGRSSPKGRPKTGESFAELIAVEFERLMADFTEESDEEHLALTTKQAMVRRFVKQALSGNLMTWVELMNRTEGKVADKTQMDVNHTVRVVPWDDDDAGLVYQQNRGLGEKPETTVPPDVALRETPALPPPRDEGDDGGGDRP